MPRAVPASHLRAWEGFTRGRGSRRERDVCWRVRPGPLRKPSSSPEAPADTSAQSLCSWTGPASRDVSGQPPSPPRMGGGGRRAEAGKGWFVDHTPLCVHGPSGFGTGCASYQSKGYKLGLNGPQKCPYLGRRWVCFRKKKELILLMKAKLKGWCFLIRASTK